MINKNTLASLVLLTTAINLPLQAATEQTYWGDSANNVVRTGYGECWKATSGMASTAMQGCDASMKKEMADADKDGVADAMDKCPGTMAGTPVDAKGCAIDSDMDGIADSSDKCPGTATGIIVDANGCPQDSDRDGVADSNDKCPGTAAGISVDASGCAKDSDRDGVADSSDKCPATPAGAKVDAQGCDVNKDDDKDGIANINDACPGTASGTVVDKRGCKLTADIRLDNVQFNTGTEVINANSRNTLDNVAKTLNDNPHLKFEVAGHTDSSGNYEANVRLSKSRADSVRQYLINSGVAANRLTARGYGPDKPVASNDTSTGRSANRRVELNLK